MKSNSPKKKRIRISRKSFEAKIKAEKNYSNKGIKLEDDPYRNKPDYYGKEGIETLKSKEKNDPVKKEN